MSVGDPDVGESRDMAVDSRGSVSKRESRMMTSLPCLSSTGIPVTWEWMQTERCMAVFGAEVGSGSASGRPRLAGIRRSARRIRTARTCRRSKISSDRPDFAGGDRWTGCSMNFLGRPRCSSSAQSVCDGGVDGNRN